jgi:hypothetical protein
VEEHMPPQHQQYIQWNGERFRKWASQIGSNTATVEDAILTGYKVEQQGYNMVFTSNRDPAQWQENFCESDSLLCALDRIFDDAIVFTIKGESFRGKKLETVSLRTTGSATTAHLAGSTKP